MSALKKRDEIFIQNNYLDIPMYDCDKKIFFNEKN